MRAVVGAKQHCAAVVEKYIGAGVERQARVRAGIHIAGYRAPPLHDENRIAPAVFLQDDFPGAGGREIGEGAEDTRHIGVCVRRRYAFG